MTPGARKAALADLTAMLDLFAAGSVSPAAEAPGEAERIWAAMLARDGLTVFVSESAARIVSTCMLVVVPNLLREGRQLGYLDNVVTHPDFQGRGHGRAVVEAALASAWESNCFHVLMQSGRKDQRVHRFYQRCGFEPGLRTAYVARRPTHPMGPASPNSE